MSIDTNRATFDPPAVTGANPQRPPEKVMRIAAMTKQLLDEVRAQRLDAPSVERLRAIDTQTIRELQTHLTTELRHELQRLAMPLTSHAALSDAELRIAHAQLVGWLEGLLRTSETVTCSPPIAAATGAGSAACTCESDSTPASPDDDDQLAAQSHSTPPDLVDADAANPTNAVPATRRTLITAITKRITEKRLTAVEVASVLHLTGPRVTKLLDAYIDEFTLDDLVSLLPALELTIAVLPAPPPDAEPSDRGRCRND